MAPIMLQMHITHRNVRKASWHPGLGHFPGTTVALSRGTKLRHVQPVRFWKAKVRVRMQGCIGCMASGSHNVTERQGVPCFEPAPASQEDTRRRTMST